MKFFTKMEYKIGRYAIKNLPFVVTICFTIGYLLEMFAPDIISYIYFSPAGIVLDHEYWRLFTWVLTPPGTVDFVALLMLLVYFRVGLSLEQAMGTFMFNVFILGSFFWNILFCLAVSIYEYISIGNDILFRLNSLYDGYMMTHYMQTSIFLCFALIYSGATILLFFMVPVKAWLFALFDTLYLAYCFMQTDSLVNKASIIAYIFNFIFIYMLSGSGRNSRRTPADIRRKKHSRFRVIDGDKAAYGSQQEKRAISKHKCAVCGKTELDAPGMDFRFCSKCNGNYEYCSEHLYTHEHIK